jgi:DNA polymerase III subunit beta
MKFSIETQILARALDIASVAADHRISLPILGSVLIEAKESQLILSSTNLDIYVRQELPAQVKQMGAITTSFTLLQKLVNRMTATEVKIEAGKTINFSSGETTAILEGLPAEEFPPDFKQTTGEDIECDAADILTPFSKLVHAMSKDPSRYNLMAHRARAVNSRQRTEKEWRSIAARRLQTRM